MSEISDLIKLYKEKPGEVEKILRDNPELARQVIELEDTLSAGEKPSVDSFRRIYAEFFGRPLPYVAEPVVEEFIWALENKKGVILEAWRGFGKSTFFTAWGPAVMGWRPHGSTTLVRVNDQKSKEMGKAIATLIMTNEGWKKIFPHVIPDEKAGWSVENGFNVLDTRVTGMPGSSGFEDRYAKWRMKCLADHLSEQSLLCAGIESGSIIGLHPTNGMWFDDLHDEKNTKSAAELKKTTDILEGNIVPTWFSAGGSPTLGVFCTPWSMNDAYQVMMKTGLFKNVKIPIFVLDDEGVEIPKTIDTAEGVVNVDPEWAGKKVKPTWPEVFPVERIAEMIHSFKTRFGQMGLLDIKLSTPKNMRYQAFPSEDIKWGDWPMTVGVDPVATIVGISSGSGISHFALAQFLLSPYGSLVLGDGVIEKCDAEAGEGHILEVQRTFSKTHRGTSIESNGAGVIFIGMVTRNKGIKLHAHTVNELGGGSKKDRQYRFLQPLFANGSIKVSDADTPFLNAVREYLDNFPNFSNDSYLWDVGDALAIGALDVPGIWAKVISRDVRENSIYDRNEKGSLWHPMLGVRNG